jgi:hypothetical protein
MLIPPSCLSITFHSDNIKRDRDFEAGCRLIFRRCLARIPIGTQDSLINVSRGFSQLLQANGGIEPRLGHEFFLPNPYQFTIHQSSYHPTLCSLSY